MKQAYARQIILDLVTTALGSEYSYRMPDDLDAYVERLLADSSGWTKADEEELKRAIRGALDDVARQLWSGLGLDEDGWQKPCEHPDCMAERERLAAQEAAGDNALAEFLKQEGLEW